MKYYKLYILSFIALFQFAGCKKFVELDAPKTLTVASTVFTDDNTAIAAVVGIYTKMNESQLAAQMPLFTGLAADELKTNNPLFAPVYQNAIPAVNPITSNTWSSSYNYIYQANAVYEGCTASTALSSAVKKQLMAEAVFIRAYWYFYLVNLYGDVPLIMATDYELNRTAARTSKDLVYQQIIKDLKNAQANLNPNYVDGTSIASSSERIRPNVAAATALLARVYLYTGDYINAEAQASVIINNKAMYDTVDINSVFLANSKEAIWQISKALPANNINTYEGNIFILTGKPRTGSGGSTTLSSQLLTAFDDSTDKRKINWVGKLTSAGVDYYYAYKYKVRTSPDITEYSMILRVAEQYLIRAEARAQQSNLGGAIADVDVIRKRAGIPLIADINPNIGKAELLTVVMKERQKEFFAEWGHRWLDLKRTGQVDGVMNAVAPIKGTTWNSNFQLWPIPQSEINNDPNLKQNPGYN
jgi:hypothetical protein